MVCLYNETLDRIKNECTGFNYSDYHGRFSQTYMSSKMKAAEHVLYRTVYFTYSSKIYIIYRDTTYTIKLERKVIKCGHPGRKGMGYNHEEDTQGCNYIAILL